MKKRPVKSISFTELWEQRFYFLAGQQIPTPAENRAEGPKHQTSQAHCFPDRAECVAGPTQGPECCVQSPEPELLVS